MKQPWPSLVPFDYTFDFFELDKLHQMDIAHRSHMKLYQKKTATTKRHQRGLHDLGADPSLFGRNPSLDFFLLRHVTTVLM